MTLLTASHDKLLGYLMSLLGRWHDAQDVLQSSSLLMWRKFETYEAGSNFVAWASTICFYEAKNFQRLAGRSPLMFDDDLLATLASERLVDLDMQGRRITALEQCLNEVGPAGRELLRIAYAEHGGIADLATRLQRAPRTLYNKLTILRRRLTECVQRRLQEGAL
ncbi:sigma factor [Schlesneria paludicola]|uniref:sigma factor n=1 Tax=Schlesneria paludicola TaxID=360056 RepID=UPI0002E50C02|nr:sigma factor [Schlesneria paludicola]